MMNHHKNNHNTVFNIISWNIQGLKTRLKPTHQGISNTKLNIKSIKANLSKFDVICLQETWAKDDSLTFEGYTVYSTIRSSKSKRGQGGVSVLIKNKHSNIVTHINGSSPIITWCCLHKSLLGRESDIYLATVYSPPLQSQKKAEDIISILDKEIRKYSAQGKIILLSDFNVRTGTLNDFIENDTHGPVLPNDIYHLDEHCPKRNNADYTVNKVGGEILRLCIENRLRILNGRITGDLDGKLTSYQRTGADTVDYGIASEELLKSILRFQVQTLTPYYDHCPISVKIPFSKSGLMNDKSNEEPVRQTEKTLTVKHS